MKGKVMTVLGPIAPEELGPTLTHEHIFIDLDCWFEEPDEPSARTISREPVSLGNLWWVRRNPRLSRDNNYLTDRNQAHDEALQFKRSGGKSIVDVSNMGIGRDPLALKWLSGETGINIIMGSGYYVSRAHPVALGLKSEDDIRDEIVRDLNEGVNGTGVRAGIIGEVGITDLAAHHGEEKSLRGAVRAQKETGAPLTIHHPLNRHETGIISILDEEGADFDHVIMGHMVLEDLEYVVDIAESGVYLGLDSFGFEGYLEHPEPFEIPSDSQKIKLVCALIDAGYLKKLLLSHDICRKHMTQRYGGCGYSHILRSVVPMMKRAGITGEEIKVMLVENPKRVLTVR